MPEPKFVVGQRVRRIEDREIVGAVVLQVVETGETMYNYTYQLQYDEGQSGGNDGTGWWPEICLEAE